MVRAGLRFGRWTGGLALAGVFGCAAAMAMSQSPNGLHLSCEGPDPAMTLRACDALEAALAPRPVLRAPAPVPARSLAVRLQITRADAQGITGRLIWRQPGAEAVTGPPLEVTISDAAPRPSTYRQFARDLLRISNLPP